MKYFAVAIICILALSCKKKSSQVPETAPAATPETLVVRETNDTKIDVDSDGSLDLELSTVYVKTGPGPSWGSMITLKCLHSEISIRAEKSSVSTFSSNTISYQQNDTVVYKTTVHAIDCAPNDHSILLSQVDKIHAKRYDVGSIAASSEQFECCELLVGEPLSKYQYGNYTKDTVFYYTNISYPCNNLLLKGDNFFSFRIFSNARALYGWIKLKGELPTVISESAIVK